MADASARRGRAAEAADGRNPVAVRRPGARARARRHPQRDGVRRLRPPASRALRSGLPGPRTGRGRGCRQQPGRCPQGGAGVDARPAPGARARRGRRGWRAPASDAPDGRAPRGAAWGGRQHRTLPPAVLAVPRRGRLVTAKVLACLPLAAGMVVLGLAVDLVLAVPWLDSQGASADVSATTWALVVAGGLLAALGAAALGVAIGFLTPFPATGIVFGVGFVLVVEPVVASRAPDLAQFLPGYAMAALVRGLTTTAHDE